VRTGIPGKLTGQPPRVRLNLGGGLSIRMPGAGPRVVLGRGAPASPPTSPSDGTRQDDD
jgi:hypothetical protein